MQSKQREEVVMNRLKRFYTSLVRAFGIVSISLFFLVFSCTQKPPTAPQSSLAPNPRAGITSADPKRRPFDKKVGAEVESPETSEDSVVYFEADKLNLTWIQVNQPAIKPVGFAGDSIPIPMGKDTSYLVIVRGALSGLMVNLNLLSSLVPTQDEKMRVVLYDFFPEGLLFEKDCYLIQPARFPDGTKLELSWFDPLGGRWTRESVGVVQNGKVVFILKHFSQYGAPLEALSSGGQ